MTTHAPTLPVPQGQPTLPNQPFFSWIRTETALFLSQIAAIFAFVYGLTSLAYYTLGARKEGGETGVFDPDTIKMAVDYAHIAVIAVFIVVLIRYLDDNVSGSYRVGQVFKRVFNDDLEREKRSDKPWDNQRMAHPAITPADERIKRLREFKRRFLWFWCMMLLLYVVFAWDHSYAWVTSRNTTTAQESYRLVWDPTNDSGIKDGTGLAGSASTEKVTPQERLPNATIDRHETPALPSKAKHDADPVDRRTVAFSFLQFFFNNISLLMVYFCFLSMYLPLHSPDATKRRQRIHLAISFTVISVFTFLYIFLVIAKWRLTVGDFRAVNAVFDALSGTMNAVVLALLIARLDSKLIGLSSRLIGVLYSYAAVQPLFVAFAQGPTSVLEGITASVLVFVLISKIYFFLIIMYALQTGRMLNYLACFSELSERATNSTKPDCDEVHTSLSGKSENKVMRVLDSASEIAYLAWRKGPEWIRKRRERLSEWMRSEGCVTCSTRLGFLSVGLFLVFLFLYLGSYQLNPDAAAGRRSWTNIGVDVVQLIIITSVSIALFLVRKDNSCHYDTVRQTANDVFTKREELNSKETLDFSTYQPTIAVDQVRKFKEYFFWFWIATWFLYVVLILNELLAKSAGAPDDIRLEIAQAARVLVFPFLSFLFGSLNLLFVFWCFVILQSPAYDPRSNLRQRLLINYSGLVVALIISAYLLLASFAVGRGPYKHTLIGYATVFDGLTGILSAVALALLIARLDSKLFRLRPPLVSMLFVYAAIQPLFVVFELEKPVFRTIETAVLLAALGLKVSFFLIVAYALQSGKMLNYLVCFPFLKDRVDSIFENQFEIRTLTTNREPKKYTFSIWKKNKLVYSTGLDFETREEVDRKVELLHALMPKFRSQNQPKPVAGTYWVEVRNPEDHDKLVCESIPLRSENERDELIKASIRNIPHCKYNRL